MTIDERATLAAVEHYDARRAALCAGAWADLDAAALNRAAIRLLARARSAELRDPDPGIVIESADQQTDRSPE